MWKLYDIANILQSLGLIRKVSLTDGRGKKPAYQYIGPEISTLEVSEDEKKGMPATRQKNSLLNGGGSQPVSAPQGSPLLPRDWEENPKPVRGETKPRGSRKVGSNPE